MSRKKNIVLYAGVMLVVAAFVLVGSASVVEKNYTTSLSVNDYVLSGIEERILRFRLSIFEDRYCGMFIVSGGCNRIYDVNRNEIINFQDAGLTWIYITTPEIHNEFGDLLYDVNYDGQVNFQDCGLIWVNRD